VLPVLWGWASYARNAQSKERLGALRD